MSCLEMVEFHRQYSLQCYDESALEVSHQFWWRDPCKKSTMEIFQLSVEFPFCCSPDSSDALNLYDLQRHSVSDFLMFHVPAKSLETLSAQLSL